MQHVIYAACSLGLSHNEKAPVITPNEMWNSCMTAPYGVEFSLPFLLLAVRNSTAALSKQLGSMCVCCDLTIFAL